jgi:hypothetical protein
MVMEDSGWSSGSAQVDFVVEVMRDLTGISTRLQIRASLGSGKWPALGVVGLADKRDMY